MKKLISIILCFMLISSIPAFAADDLKFSDVDASTDMGKAILKLANAGVIEGNGDGTFAPDRKVKRSELCKMVNNIWKLTEEDSTSFADVTENDWYFSHVKIAKKAGYIKGFEDGTFRGENNVTREQVCAIIVRVGKVFNLGIDITIADAVSPWAKDYVDTIVGNYLIPLEKDNTFRATEDMTRGELAMALSSFITETKEPEKEDDKKTETPSGTSRPSSGNNSSSGSNDNDDDEDQYYGDGDDDESGNGESGDSEGGNDDEDNGEGTEPEPVFDAEKQNEVIDNLEALLVEFDNISSLPWIVFTEKEIEIVDMIKSTIDKTIADGQKGEWIYVENYVYKTYKTEVESVRAKCDALKETEEFEAFKGKLKELPIYLLEYLSKTMFGVDVQDYL